MRQARFSGLGTRGEESAPSLPALLCLDFRAATGGDQASLVAERARAIAVAVPLLACWHGVWMAILLHALWTGGALASPVPALLAAILLLDLGLWAALRRPRLAALGQVRLVAAHTLVAGALWVAAAFLAGSGPAGGSLAVRAALIAGTGSSLPAFFLVPALAAASCLLAWLASAALSVDPSLLVIVAALNVVLVWLSLFRARDQVLAGRHRLRLEAEAEKAGRFVADYEASGRGWFWEANADGLLTYASEQLAAALGLDRAAILGRRFEELLPDGADNPLGFHLSARFPFSDVMVRAPGGGENWWSLSGRPNFDGYGRFLGFRGLGVNLSEQQRGEAETKRLARFDSLTGLPNRATMRTMLDAALANAAERRQGCALLMIDLDRFKQVNDSFGHPVGDKLLRKVAARLTAAVGDRGEIGRLGGDEFEAILPGLDAEGALTDLARALIAEISRPYVVDGHRLEIGTSVGIAVARPGRSSAAGLVRDADLALYAAKAAGRGTVRLFAPEMHAEAAERQRLEQDLRQALAKGELRLLFQPIVDSGSEEVLAFEALLRWHHPVRGVVPPATLIPLAEECGLMPQIGDWILRTACAEAAKWPGHIRLAVNLSSAQLADPALPATLTATLAQSGLDPDRLELEVNEAAYLAAGGGADARLERLKRIGIRLVLDNYGSGQAGFGVFGTAPFDKLKIDRGFAADAAARGSRNAAILRGIVGLAESLGLDTTAEGVETAAQLALVRRLGCRQAQGFLFAPPLAAEEALARAAESRPTAEVIGFSRPPRHRLIRNGRLRSDGRAVPVRVRNISEGGAMVDCASALEPGARVTLDIDDAGSVEAEIRWCQRGQIGLMFERPYILALLGRARPAPGPAPKMVTPRYLDPSQPPPAAAEPSGPSPLATKRRRSG
jgi:diguanylate cyclase (GGDEF)-like protein